MLPESPWAGAGWGSGVSIADGSIALGDFTRSRRTFLTVRFHPEGVLTPY